MVETIETEVKPALGVAYMNCTVGFLDAINQVVWLRVYDGAQISQNELIVIMNKLDSYGNPKYEVQKRQGRSAAVPAGYSSDLWTYMLIIRQLQQSDAGTYRCQIVVQGAQNYPYRDATLIVQGKFRSEIYVKEGQRETTDLLPLLFLLVGHISVLLSLLVMLPIT